MPLDPGPIARLEDVKKDADAPGEIFRLLCDGYTLAQIFKQWKCAKGLGTKWFMEAHAGLYDAALKVRADELAHSALERADKATSEDVGPRKLQVETRLKLAEKWDRDRYGAKVKVDHGGSVAVDAGLLGTIAEMLALRAKRPAVVVEGEAVPQLPEKV